MLALIFDGTVKLDRNAQEPLRAPGEALIATELAGICDTDLQVVRGYMGYRGVLGHEFVGRVVQADDPSWAGRRVVADINAGCGRCEDCLQRDGHHCATRTVLGIAGRPGVMAEYFVIPERNLVAVPDEVPSASAVFAEPLAAALHVLDELRGAGDRVAVVGDGKLGLLTCAATRSAGASVTLFGHHPDKLALARSWGVTTTYTSEQQVPARAFDVVVEASGQRSGLDLALSLVRPRGTIVLKTTVSDPYAIDLAPLVIHELRVVGSRCGDLRKAIALLQAGAVDPRPLITAQYPLSRAEEAISHAQQKGVGKVLIAWSPEAR